MSNDKDTISHIKVLGSGEEFPRNPIKKSELVHVSLHGLNLPENSATKLESEISNVIREEIKRTEQEKLEKKNGLSRGEENGINISLHALDLPETSRARLESQIKEVVSDYMGKDLVQSKSSNIDALTGTCVCAGPGPAVYNLNFNPPLPRTFPRYPAMVAVYTPFGDAIRMEIHNPTGLNLGLNEIVVSLSSESNIRWYKQIKSFNLCTGMSYQILYTLNDWHGNRTGIKIKKATCAQGTDTLVFAKAGFLGGLQDIACFNMMQFWDNLGGRRLHFVWVDD